MNKIIVFLINLFNKIFKKKKSADEVMDNIIERYDESWRELADYGREEVPMKQYKIIIDPGHGGKDPGAIGSFSKEKVLNLVFSKKLYELLNNNINFIPKLTRDSDVYINLKKRVDITKDYGADVFISMHCNASKSSKPHDCQIYYNSDVKDKPFAEIIFDHVDKVDHGTSKWSREIKANFFVLRNLSEESTSAILVEIGFISNPEDELLLNDEVFQNEFVEGLYNGIKNFFNV